MKRIILVLLTLTISIALLVVVIYAAVSNRDDYYIDNLDRNIPQLLAYSFHLLRSRFPVTTAELAIFE